MANEHETEIVPNCMVLVRRGRCGRGCVPATVVRVNGDSVTIVPRGHKQTEVVDIGHCKPWRKGNFLVGGGKR